MLISFHDESVKNVTKILENYKELKLDGNFLEIEHGHDVFNDFLASGMPFEVVEVVKLRLFGMTCTSCSGSIEENINLLNGVLDCKVNLAMEYCIVRHFHKLVGVRDIINRIEELGFDALLMDMSESIQLSHLQKTKDIVELRSDFQRSLYYTIPNMILMLIHEGPEVYNLYVSHVIQLVLATIAMCTVGRRFYVHAYYGLFTRSFTMDTLIALGTLSAYLFSLLMMIHHCFYTNEHLTVFFDTTTMLITFILLGKFMETSAKVKTSSALSALLQLKPENAKLVELTDQGKSLLKSLLSANEPDWAQLDRTVDKQTTISSDLIQFGDILCILPGERIPADGFIIWGSTSIDESLITGESLPVAKSVNDNVICGSINGATPIRMYANAVGNDTTLHRIIKLVEKAQSVKAPIEYISDAIAGVFVPFVIILAIFTFVTWYILLNMKHDLFGISHDSSDTLFICVKICISVVVIACPCTLGLAVPTSVMVGTGVGAKLGILIKGGASLEQAHKLTTLVFDKTGTLTTGKMSLVSTKLKINKREFWSIMTNCELQSEHPIAQAITRHGKQILNWNNEQCAQYLQIESIKNIAGNGLVIKAMVPDIPTSPISPSYNAEGYVKHLKTILIGNKALLTINGINCVEMDEFMQSQSEMGHTVIYMAMDDVLMGCLSMGDVIKPYALECVQGLIKMNINVIMCTGDSMLTARAIAKQCGITNIYAEQTPLQKSNLIKELKQQKCNRAVGWFDSILRGFKAADQRHVIGFVGDGINDSIALAEADVGIALGSGTDVAMETADIILMKSEILDVVTSIDLSRHIFNRIKINFVWAFGYNMISIPLAMGFGIPFGIFLHPMTAGAAMAFSSVSVVTSSLLLKFYKVPRWIRQLRGELTNTSWQQRWISRLNWVTRRRDTTEYHQL